MQPDDEVYAAYYDEQERAARSQYPPVQPAVPWPHMYPPPGPSMPYPRDPNFPGRNPGPSSLVPYPGYSHYPQRGEGPPVPSSSMQHRHTSSALLAQAPSTSHYAYQAPALPPAAPSGSSASPGHPYRRLSSISSHSGQDAVVDDYLGACKVGDKRAWQCCWDGCSKEPFKSKDNARVHVHKHLGRAKLFECTTCGIQFASEDAAKRHRDTTESKAYSCEYCHHQFARKDYRDLHRKKCSARG